MKTLTYRNLRAILKRPALALPTIAGLMVGIGASTAVFSAYSAMESIGFRDPGRLVSIWLTDPAHNQPQVELSFGDWRAWRGNSQVAAADVALASSVNLDFSMYFDGVPEHVDGSTVTGNFFRVLGATPLAGSLLTDDDDQPGAPLRIVISHRMFVARFGGDYGVVGRQVRLGGSTAVVAGIARPEFDFPRDTAVWLPLRPASPDIEKSAWIGVFQSVARLGPGMTPARAQAQLDAALRLDSSRPATAPALATVLKPIRDEVYGVARPAVAMLMGAVLLLLLIACANAANLMLALHAERAGEMAVRAVLGAGRWRIARMLMSESAAIAAIGGLGGLALARGAIAVFAGLAPPEMPSVDRITLNWPVALFGLGITAIALLLFSAGPALLTSIVGGVNSSQVGSGSRTIGGKNRLRHQLITAEVALSVMLVIGAGLLLRSFRNLAAVDPGFRAEHILTFRITTEFGDQPSRRAMYSRVLEKLRALPGVESAGAILLRPLSGAVGWDTNYLAEGQQVTGVTNPSGNYEAISPGYFQSLRIPLIAGRDFDSQDNENTAGVVIINRATAQRHWPNGSAVGAKLRLGGRRAPWLTVVGVVGDVRYREWEAARPDFYVPYLQRAQHRSDFVVRTHGDPWALTAAVRRAVFEVDKNQPISNVTTLDALVDKALARARVTTILLTSVAFAALALAGIGIYGLLSYLVQQRTREIGVRTALGATPRQVAGLITFDVIRFVGIGMVSGVFGAALVARTLRSQFFGVGSLDPTTYLASFVVLLLIAALAAAVPARRAALVDPAVALRR